MSGPDAGSYFAVDASLRPAGKGAYVEIERLPTVEFVDGLVFRPVVGEGLMVNFVRYRPHTEAPTHTHEEEQVTFVLDGEFDYDNAHGLYTGYARLHGQTYIPTALSAVLERER